MPYLHQSICISFQQTYPFTDLTNCRESKNNLLEVFEPPYPGIPPGARRRMGKSVRMAVGAALPLLENPRKPDGIVIGTANGGMEDCIKFLNQILEYKEGLLTPGSFVQSTSNASAAQIALITKNHEYNITHVHRGLAFENALLDCCMLLKENPHSNYLLGCVDEISSYNYNIDRLAGWFRDEPVLNLDLFHPPAKGTIAGEGAFMTLINNERQEATAELVALKTIHTEHPAAVLDCMHRFLSDHLTAGNNPDLLLTGENGDERLNSYYQQVENYFPEPVPVARFKHLSGEYCTASSFACWLSTEIFKTGQVPSIIMKNGKTPSSCQRILIYNHYRGAQHAFMLIDRIAGN